MKVRINRKYFNVLDEQALRINMQADVSMITTKTLDISEAGVCCLTSKQVPLNRELDLKLTVPQSVKNKMHLTEEIACKGLVIRNRPISIKKSLKYDVAFLFIGLTDERKGELSSLVEGYRKIGGLELCTFMPVAKERRHTIRIKAQCKLTIGNNNPRILADTLKILPSGLICEVDQAIPLFREIQIDLTIPSFTRESDLLTNHVCCTGVVVKCDKMSHIEDRYDMELFFTEISDKDKVKIAMAAS